MPFSAKTFVMVVTKGGRIRVDSRDKIANAVGVLVNAVAVLTNAVGVLTNAVAVLTLRRTFDWE